MDHVLQLDIEEIKILLDSLELEKKNTERSLEYTLSHEQNQIARGNAEFLRNYLDTIDRLREKLERA